MVYTQCYVLYCIFTNFWEDVALRSMLVGGREMLDEVFICGGAMNWFSLQFDNVGNKAKRRISNLVFQESKAHQNFRKTNISYPPIHTHHMYVCVSGGKKCLFFGNFGVFCFLETPVLRFALLPYD